MFEKSSKASFERGLLGQDQWMLFPIDEAVCKILMPDALVGCQFVVVTSHYKNKRAQTI